MNQQKQYFFTAFATLLLAVIVFLACKEFLPSKLFPSIKKETTNITVDSLLLEAITNSENETTTTPLSADTVAVATTNVTIDTVAEKIITPQTYNGILFPPENYSNYKGTQYLLPFYEKLYQLQNSKKGTIRIAYFGDSMIDGDLIVQDIRTYFQNEFGGKGVGFVSITSESAKSRASVKHTFSNNWKSESYIKGKHPKKPFGVNGHTFYANDTLPYSWVEYKASYVRHLTHLPQPTLFYGYDASAKNGKVFQVIDNDTIETTLQPINKLNTLTLHQSSKKIRLYFKNTDSIPIYGVNFDDKKGVHIDNFSSRGNSGLPLSLFNSSIINAFQNILNYDLVILHYGTNVLSHNKTNYSWYGKRMKKTVQHLKKCFKNTPILIVSIADKSAKYDLEMKTDSAVMPLLNVQKEYAINSKSGFLNLYQAMGGKGSMIKWVEASPSLANKDYTHFNPRGAKKIARIIYNNLEEGFVQYKKLQKQLNEEQQPENDSLPTNLPILTD